MSRTVHTRKRGKALKALKNIPCPKGNEKGHHTGKQDNRIFKAFADLKQNPIKCISQRLCTHGYGKNHGDHLPDQMGRRLPLNKAHHLHGENSGAHHNGKAAGRDHHIMDHSR